MKYFIKQLVVLFLLLQITNYMNAQDSNFHIYLCFGQSNMEGQGAIEGQDSTVNERFQVFQALNCPEAGRKKAQWYPAVPPLCQCHSGLSPADYFGRTMVQELPDSVKVGVIVVAVGGCDIRLFDKDIYEGYTQTFSESWFTDKIAFYQGNPYKYLLDLARRAQNDGVIKGILLHQGETNTGDTLWPTYVKKIYTDLLNDLSLKANKVPLVAGEVVSVKGSCCASMNPVINQLPKFIPTAHVVSSKGCTAKDEAHFDAAGYRLLGERYARKILEIKK